MKISIKVKSSVFLAVLLVITVITLSALVLSGIQSNQKQQYEDYLLQQGAMASNYVKQTYLMESIKDPEDFMKERSEELVNRFELISGMHIILYNMQGVEIANSRPVADKVDVSKPITYALKDKTTYFEDRNRIIFLSPLHNAYEQIGVIQFNYSIEKNKAFYKHIKYLFLFAGIFVFLICFIVGYIFVLPLTEGILKLKNATNRIKDGNYEDILVLKRKDELGELSRGIYFMGSEIKKNLGEMKEEQNKLKLAVEKLEILGAAQKKFIGNVTHEFKTPLTVIKAYVDLMDMYPEDLELKNEARENIDKETQRLSEMVEKVLELSSLEKYEFELHKESVDIYEVLYEICERMKGKVQKFGLTLHTKLEHHIILADSDSMEQIFINLLDNAIKYNRPKGDIWLECGEKKGNLYILVRDTGIGIPFEARGKIFEPFYTVDNNRSRQTSSTGLGLSLVKQLVEKQGGTIELLHMKTEGTTFEIIFPFQRNGLQL